MLEEADGSLLYYISCRDCDADRTLSDAAATEFNRRYGSALYRRCRRVCRTLGVSEDTALDLVSCTLVKAAEKFETFIDAPDAIPPSVRTLRWLGTIARNLLVDSLRNPNRPGPITGAGTSVAIEDYSDTEFAALLCDGKSIARDRRTIELVRQGLAMLDQRTRSVLAHTILQRQRSPQGSYMYRGSAKALAESLSTTPENVRRIRREGMKALARFVRGHSK